MNCARILPPRLRAELYERQTAVDPRFASVWHWTLVLIMFLVLTNTALAILVEARLRSCDDTAHKDASASLYYHRSVGTLHRSRDLRRGLRGRAPRARVGAADADPRGLPPHDDVYTTQSQR